LDFVCDIPNTALAYELTYQSSCTDMCPHRKQVVCRH
jgi:hypothetical protein